MSTLGLDPGWAERYAATMAAGQVAYQDVLAALAEHGHKASFTQTGGMNAALYVELDGGYLLITDQDDSLSWHRNYLAGWMVGLYTGDEDGEVVRYAESGCGDIPTLLELVEQVLRP